MVKLVTNPNYGKVRSATVMLKDMAKHVESISVVCLAFGHLAQLTEAKSILASSSDYTTVAFAVWRIMNTLPSEEVPAQRKINAREFKKELYANHGNDDQKVKKIIGGSLVNNMIKLMTGETFTPVESSTPKP